MNIIYVILLGMAIGCTSTNKRDTRWMLDGFVKANEFNPVLTADTASSFFDPIRNEAVKWQAKDVFNPSSLVLADELVLVYRGEDFIGKHNGTSRLGIARSKNGIDFVRENEPIFYPSQDAQKPLEWEGGVEDPRIVQDIEGIFWMTYTAYDGKVARLLIASSQDLYHWEKYGSVFTDLEDAEKWSKSGSIVSTLTEGKMLATQINGFYWMYFGDTNLFLAKSPDLISWTILKEANGDWQKILIPRAGMFDSRLVEAGPPAMITSAGILLLYNGMNLDVGGAIELPSGTYSAGQALFDRGDPARLIDRSNKPFLVPDQAYEMTGQVNNVCFIEGLSYFNNQWFLFYGTADSKIAVAISSAVSHW